MSNGSYQLETPKIGQNFRNMVNNRSESKKSRSTTSFLIHYSSIKTHHHIFHTSSNSLEIITCKCQNKNVKINPIPKPMSHATNRNDEYFKLAKCFSTVIHSGISLVVWANIFVYGSKIPLKIERLLLIHLPIIPTFPTLGGI